MKNLLIVGMVLAATGVAAQQSPIKGNSPELTAQMNGQMAKRNTAVFEENKGQMKDQHWQPRPDVLFNGSAQGMHYYIRDNGMSYQLSRVESWKEEEDDRFDMPGKEKRQVPDELGTYRVDVEWTDFNADFTVEKGKELEGYTNYYNVPEGVEPALFVKQYESVTLKGLWPGIDLRCYSTDGMLETDWLVAAGADYSQIRFEVKGAELSTDDAGHLIMSTPFGEIREGGLKVFQEGRQLEARWVIAPLEGEVPGGMVSFEVLGHDPMLAMRIDPVVRVWGTYYGGSGEDIGNSCATDGSGNVYMAGLTESASMIASGGHQNSFGGEADAFVVKFNGEGIRQWATYFGGNEEDIGRSCATSALGDVYLAGQTRSIGGIAMNGHQNEAGLYRDAFLVKFSPDGTRQWGTYYGGLNDDWGYSCITDSEGNVHLAGQTRSTNQIAFNGYQNTLGGEADAFLTKFNSNGILLWGTYFGGGGNDYGRSCAIDINDNIYLCGQTQSAANIASNGHQNIFGTGGGDAFLVKFDASGVRVWATYYGGTGTDWAYSCATDNNGNVFMAGDASGLSSDAIAFNGHQNIPGGQSDAFVVKFNSEGIRQWGTYYGGSLIDLGAACATDSEGNVYLAGWTFSSSTIAMFGLQNTLGGTRDIFLVKLDKNGVREWGTYYGSADQDFGYSVAVDSYSNVFICGETISTNNMDFMGHQNTYAGEIDAFLVKFKQPRVSGKVWLDNSADCIQGEAEVVEINGIGLSVHPGDLVVQSVNGLWSLDFLPAGDYTVTIDTTSPNWIITCPTAQSFTVVHPDSFLIAPSFGMVSTDPCPSPDVSIVMPQMRRGIEEQIVYVSACNEPLGTSILEDAYCIVELDEHISVQSASLPYTQLDGNRFQFDLGDINPGLCVDFTLNTTVMLTAVANQTLCLSAELYPQPECVFDTVPDPFPPTVTACEDPWDGSKIAIEAFCEGDSVRFTVTNVGADMECHGPIRVYLDGAQVMLDSLMLAGGDSATFAFAGLAHTWRLEVDQHPEHPGSSNPSASIELCGTGNWIPRIINQFPQDDADPIRDIFCDEVSAPYDPNDKTGSPRGLGETHAIQQNQQIEYLVRFQNVGTDTAVNVVVLDTLSIDLNIFTVQSGVSSHPYEFRMYGPRVLEWRFNNIILPDRTTDNPGSNGFVMFKVQQVPDLPYGTVIENTANIYFDFEEPVITNTYFHTVTDFSGTLFPAPEAGLVSQGVLCDGQDITLSASQGQGYLWNTGDTTQSINVSDEGDYWVTVSYQDGTVSTSPTMSIATVPNPTVVMADVAEGLNILSAPVELEGTPSGGTFTGTAVSGNLFSPSEAGLGEHCVTYTYTDEVGCGGADIQCVTVDFAVGVGEEQAVTFTVFPNPGNGLFTLVTSAEGMVRLTVKDISGREVVQESYTTTPGTARSIDLSDQANGIYTLRIETEKGTSGVKLVKE